MVTVSSVETGSLAHRAGIEAGDVLVSVNSHPVRDVLDYRFFLTERRVELEICRGGEKRVFVINKAPYDDIGLEFETFLMDKKETCRNRCIFCFIDQNPPGMRDTVYFKDDDTRLSFLMGNYVTLTNVDRAELDRIRAMRLSPVNVSVHTTDPALRIKMLNNRFAGDIMEKLRYLAEGGISLNCQLVLCRGINDGESLDRTLEDLFSLGEAVESVAAVPAGITAHREGLYPLVAYDRDSAAGVLERVARFQDRARRERGTSFVFCSDEFYVLAGVPVPPPEFYEGYPQLDNGVGSLASMLEELDAELEGADLEPAEGSATVFCGVAAYDYVKLCVDRIKEKAKITESVETVAAENLFFGSTVTVSGLLTGGDIVAAAKKITLGDRVLLPARMLRSEGDLFLDDMTPGELSEKIGRPLVFTDGAADLVAALTKKKGARNG